MVTKNFVPAISFATDWNNGNIALIKMDGSLYTMSFNNTQYPLSEYANGLYCKKESYNGQIKDTAKGMFIFVGDGATPATQNDVNLESHIPYSDAGLCVIDSNVSFIRSQDVFLTFTVTVENKTDSSINISEVGLFFRPNSGNWGNEPNNYMLARDVFDSISIEPGDIKTITMMIKP